MQPSLGIHRLPQPGKGPREGGPNKAHPITFFVKDIALSEAFHFYGRNSTSNLRIGTWNVRKILGTNKVGGETRPQIRTDLIALKLDGFKVDITVPQDTKR